MRLITHSHRVYAHHVDTSHRPGLSWHECALAAFALLGLLAALLLPATALPAHYHDFADQRGWLGLPNAMDVLSNLFFAVIGVLVLLPARLLKSSLSKSEFMLTRLTAAGLLATAVCSSIYHLRPDTAGLLLDRAGMGLAFAGVLGLAVAARVSQRAGVATAAAVALLAPLAAGWDAYSGNMTPWAVLQGGGVLLLAALAMRPVHAGSLRIALWPLLGLYALAKALELADAPLLALTQGLLSGHSAKHVVAALAVWPVIAAVRRHERRAFQ